MKKQFSVFVIGTLFAVGCGSKTQPAAAPAGGATEGHEHMKGEHEMHLTPELDAFHAVLAPHWHAAEGPQRMTDTCAAMPQFQSTATAVQAAATPTGADPAIWTAGATDLVTRVATLNADCGKSDAAAFKTDFEAVHNAFHHLMEQLPGMKEMHEHMHGMHGDQPGEMPSHEGAAPTAPTNAQ